METNPKTDRRSFIGKLAAGTTLGIPAMVSALQANAFVNPANPALAGDADEWFKKVKGKHRIVYDAPEPHDGFPVIWTWVYYTTNNQTGTPDNDMTAMIVLRHNAIPFAMEDRLWEKYKFGEVFKVNDNSAKTPALRNPYWIPKEGDMPMPQIEGLKQLQSRGAMYCVCDMALTVYSSFIAQSMNLKPEDVKKDWVSGVLPGVQIVPSGVWAIGRAQQNGCAYCYAGG
jgi:intracellular sulfur oxidation DsrE/DsrF family protein